MTTDKATAVMALKLIAAKAAKLADDLERGRLWDGELTSGVAEIRKQLADAELPEGRGG